MFGMVRVVVLTDNKALNLEPTGLKAEWGFSALIEANNDVILFDTGQNSVAFENFMLLKCKKPSKIVLSHGHFDHTGGLLYFLKNLEISKIYAHPDVFATRYYKGKYIGIPFKREQLENYAEIVEMKDPIEVSKNVWALGEIPRKHESALLPDSYIVRDKKEFDEIKDDQSIAIKTDKGVVLILGCCHAGIRNTIEYAEEVVSDEVKFVIGGTHLIAFKEQKLMEIIDWLKKKVEIIAPCHCTGLENEFLLMKEFGDRFKLISSGSVIEI